MEKLMPQNTEAEMGVLGSIIIDPEAIVHVIEFLQPDDFYRETHRTIYETIITIYRAHEPPDFITICDALERKSKLSEVGGASYITGLVNAVPTSGNIAFYGHIVEQKAIHRRLIHAAGQIAAQGYEEAPDAVLKADEIIYRISQGRKLSSLSTLEEALARYQSKLEMLVGQKQEGGIITGVPTGFTPLDKMTGGLQRTDLIVLAARPGIGKTAASLNIARNALFAGKHVLFFSVEMAEEQLIQRLLSGETQIDQARLRMADIDEEPVWVSGMRYESEWDLLVKKTDALIEAPGRLWIDDSTSLTTLEMRSRARRIQQEYGLDLVIVDYLQLVKAHGETENFRLAITQVAQNLKGLARELKVPVLALAQLSRSAENAVPQLSHLKETGAIEESSDVVAFLHVEDFQMEAKMKSLPYNINVIVAKHRNGPVGAFKVRFTPHLTQFTDIAMGIVA